MTDIATMTAMGNDIDFSRVFVNQLRLLGQPGDMALAVSTSGKSPNLIYALEEARKQGMLTIAWGGKDGGRFPSSRIIASSCRRTAFTGFRKCTPRSCTCFGI